MDRRTVLQATGAVFLGLTAGCLGNDEEPFKLTVANKDFGANEDGTLTVWVTVTNPGNENQSGIVYVTATVNEESKVRTREVTLDAHETTEISVPFETTYENVTQFEMDASVDPPSIDG